ncbi:MAG: hypothetical protein AABY07_02565 [Nanoarchaeota archaeon]
MVSSSDKKIVTLIIGVILAGFGVTNTFNQTLISVILVLLGVVLIIKSLE